MALIKPFSDPAGNDYASSYWRVTGITISSTSNIIAVVFGVWKDAEAFAAGKEPIPNVSKTYTITGADFLSVASAAPTGATLYDVLANASEGYALSKLDTDGVSFFDGATQS